MNGPFFRNYTNHQHQQPSRSSRSVPVQQAPQRSSPKVISVPVHFVSSDEPRISISMLKDSAAVKIQKVFRGFVVRKSVKKIVSIRNEVSEIERRIGDNEVVDLIRRDAKERLRVNETIMSLLFKLDSIRGVDSGVRDLRKAVTRKAIALQEKVDSIAQFEQQTLDDNSVCTSASITSSDQVTKGSDSVNEMTNDNNHVDLEAVEDDEDDSVVVKEVVEEAVKDLTHVKDEDVIGEVEAMETSSPVKLTEFGGRDDTATDLQKQKEGSCTDYTMETSPFANSSELGGKDDAATCVQQQNEGNCAINDAMETSSCLKLSEFGEKDDTATDSQKQSCDKGNIEILKSLVDDNEKMMRLMSQISERNEMQTRMINSLSRRVEQLEKALATEKQRKKKKAKVSLRRRDQDSFCMY